MKNYWIQGRTWCRLMRVELRARFATAYIKRKMSILHECVNRYDHVACPGEKVSRAWRRFIIGFWVTHTHAVAWWPLWMHTTYNSVWQIDGRCRGRIENLHSRICGSNGVRAISLCPLRENIEAAEIIIESCKARYSGPENVLDGLVTCGACYKR